MGKDPAARALLKSVTEAAYAAYEERVLPALRAAGAPLPPEDVALSLFSAGFAYGAEWGLSNAAEVMSHAVDELLKGEEN